MKKIMSKFQNILLENLLLLCLLIGFGIGIFLALWKCSLEGILREVKTAYDAITPAIYTEASEFTEGIAMVTDQEGNQYKINTDGWKISKGKRGM